MNNSSLKYNVNKHTRKWVETFIVAHNICPFAHKEVEEKTVKYTFSSANNMVDCLEDLIRECVIMDSDHSMTTTLLSFPNAFEEFDDFLDFLDLSQRLLVEQGYEGIYQLAHFHPKYCFEGMESEDPSNYTNRSPYPLLHIIREEDLENALKHYPHPEEIPKRNVKYTRELGLEKVREIRENCFKK